MASAAASIGIAAASNASMQASGRALGSHRHDAYSPPYFASTAAGTRALDAGTAWQAAHVGMPELRVDLPDSVTARDRQFLDLRCELGRATAWAAFMQERWEDAARNAILTCSSARIGAPNPHREAPGGRSRRLRQHPAFHRPLQAWRQLA